MTDLRIKIADFIFLIHGRYPELPAFCKDYLTDACGCDLEITVSEEEIAFERDKALRQSELEGIPCEEYSPGQLETTAVYRRIADFLSFHDACVFHGALICLQGEGYLFTARSGVGKTTHIRNWKKQFPDTVIVNGDKPVLRMMNGRVMAYGTPWAGKEGDQVNMAVELKSVIHLKRGTENRIRKTVLSGVFPVLLSQMYRPEDGYGLKRMVDLVGKMSDHVYFYELHCNLEQESAQVAYEGICECMIRVGTEKRTVE